jgi:hypothetical protein
LDKNSSQFLKSGNQWFPLFLSHNKNAAVNTAAFIVKIAHLKTSFKTPRKTPKQPLCLVFFYGVRKFLLKIL